MSTDVTIPALSFCYFQYTFFGGNFCNSLLHSALFSRFRDRHPDLCLDSQLFLRLKIKKSHHPLFNNNKIQSREWITAFIHLVEDIYVHKKVSKNRRKRWQQWNIRLNPYYSVRFCRTISCQQQYTLHIELLYDVTFSLPYPSLCVELLGLGSFEGVCF